MALLVNLPIELSLSILTEWIQIKDLTSLDIAFCSHPQHRTSAKSHPGVSRQDYLQILQNTHFILSDFIFCGNEINRQRYLKWLAKRGIKTQKLSFTMNCLPEIFTHDHLNVSKVKEIQFIKSKKGGAGGGGGFRLNGTGEEEATEHGSGYISQLTSNFVNQVWSFMQSSGNSSRKNDNNEDEKTFEDADLLLLSRELPVNIESITFRSWPQLTNNQLTLLLSKSNLQLRSIDLSKCFNITDDALVLICQQYSHSLESLNLNLCVNIRGIFFSAVYSLCKQLKIINLSYCHRIGRDLLEVFLTRYHHLSHFICEDLSIVTNDLIRELAMNNPNLRMINIDYCQNVNIDCLNEVLQIHPNLEYFLSKDCCYMYDQLGGDVNKMSGKKVSTAAYIGAPIISRELMLKGCYTRQTAINQLLSNFPVNNEVATGLQSINASECRKFSDISIQAVAMKFSKSLISLKISPWKDIQMDSFFILFHSCSNLQIINLSHCDTLTNPVLQEIAKKLHSLKEFYINYCPLITDEGLLPVLQSCKDLRILECENCLKITNQTIQNIFQYLFHLQRLNIVATGITSHCFQYLISTTTRQSGNEGASSGNNEEREPINCVNREYWEMNENQNTFITLVSEYWRDSHYWKYYQLGNELQKKILKKVHFIPTQMSHNHLPHQL